MEMLKISILPNFEKKSLCPLYPNIASLRHKKEPDPSQLLSVCMLKVYMHGIRLFMCFHHADVFQHHSCPRAQGDQIINQHLCHITHNILTPDDAGSSKYQFRITCIMCIHYRYAKWPSQIIA